MLTQYTNIDNILNADGSLSGYRIQKKHKKLLQYNEIPVKFIPSISNDYGCEFHVYSNDEWLTGNHNLQLVDPLPEYKDKITNQPIQFTNQPLAIDLYNEFYQLNLLAGQYRVIINFFDSYIGNYDAPSLKIDEISPNRTEVRLKVIDSDNIITKHEFMHWINNVNLTAIPTTNERFLLNFSRNKTAVIVNSVIRGQYLYVKLYEPLDKLIEKDFTCWVVRELKPPYIDLVSIIPKSVDETVNVLSGPNWYAYNSYEISSETGLKNWNDLLGSSIRTSQEIVDSYFSGSLSGIKLNIDYTDFNNFIFYSSATERLENFRYKLNLLELYAQQSSSILELSGSVATTNAIDYENNRTKLIGSFDDFEQHLFYKSSSALFSNEIPAVNPNVGFITGSYITDAPKSNSTYPYTLYSISSSQFINWFDGVLDSASVYDNRNTNALLNTVPTHLLQDRENNGLTTFVNMLGQHYDILYTYINAMTKINNREEHPQLGMPNELLYSVAKQFGWNLADGNQYQELWEYVLGTSEAGIPLTGSNSVGVPAVSGKDMTYHVWRRIVNNLPGLLKSKGTKRSIQALLACYGIPQSLISINEYGGPRIDRAPIYEKLNFDYALDLISNPAGTVTVNYDQPIDSIELRFRTDNIITNPTMPSTMNLYSVGSNEVTIDFSRGNLGTININGTASAEIECFDGEWVNTILRTGSYVPGIGMVYGSGAYGSGTYGSGTPGGLLELVAKKSKWGKIVATVSASATASLPTTGTVSLGTATTVDRLYGELQELRLWTGSLLDPAFINHTKAPAAYDGNVDAYDELAFRLPLTQKINHTLTSSLPGVEPNPTGISASFASWTNSTPYDSIEETYYYDAISLGIGTFDDNKIRLESNELIGTLDVATRAERSQYDKAPLDSKKLGVYYSPETMIDEDIIAQLGFQRLDDYIGDPGDVNSRSYPDLIQEAENYWKKYKYNTKNDINAYLKIFSLYDLSFFSQLEQLLPARADKITGVLIQPNILERSKDTVMPSVGRELITYNTNPIQTINNVISGSYLYYPGELSTKIFKITAIDDDQLNGYLTSSEGNAYNSMSYSQTNVIRSGSVWIDSTVTFAGTLPTITGSRVSEFRQIEYKVPRSPSLYHSFGGDGSQILDPNIFTVESASIYTADAEGIRLEAPALTNGIYHSGWRTKKDFFRSDQAVAEHEFKVEGIIYGSRTYGAGFWQGDNQGFGGGRMIYGFIKWTDIIRIMPYSPSSDSAFPAGYVDLVSGLVEDDVIKVRLQLKAGGGAMIEVFKNGTLAGTHDWGAEGNETELGFGVTLQGAVATPVTAGGKMMSLNIQGTNSKGYLLRPAEFQDYLPIGLNNQRYFGSKISSAAFNVNSTQTVDGGPVVEWSVANPNQLIYQPLGQQGNFSLQGQVNKTLPLQTTTPAPNASTTNQATQTR